jgi:putative membrane protein
MKALLLGASVAALLAAAPAWAQTTDVPQQPPLSNQDRQFIATAQDDNLAKATLGALAEQRGGTVAVREFGRWMATDHNYANKWLQSLAARVNEHRQPMLTEKDKALEMQLQPLNGTEFDRQYLSAMVRDHEQTIKLFETEAQSGENKHIKGYAQSLLPVIQQHLAEAQELEAVNAVGSSGSSMRHGAGTSENPEATPEQK